MNCFVEIRHVIYHWPFSQISRGKSTTSMNCRFVQQIYNIINRLDGFESRKSTDVCILFWGVLW